MPMHTADTSRIMENHMSSLNLGAHWIFAAQLRGTWTEHGLELLQELWGLPKSLTCSPIPDSQGYEEIDNVHHCLSPNRTPGNNWWSSEIVNTPCFAEQMSCPWNLYCVSPYDGCVVQNNYFQISQEKKGWLRDASHTCGCVISYDLFSAPHLGNMFTVCAPCRALIVAMVCTGDHCPVWWDSLLIFVGKKITSSFITHQSFSSVTHHRKLSFLNPSFWGW